MRYPSELEISRALARGYCWPDNSKKELDVKLIEAMAREVIGVFEMYAENEALIERDKQT